MKKIVIFFLSVIYMVSVAGCGAVADGTAPGTEIGYADGYVVEESIEAKGSVTEESPDQEAEKRETVALSEEPSESGEAQSTEQNQEGSESLEVPETVQAVPSKEEGGVQEAETEQATEVPSGVEHGEGSPQDAGNGETAPTQESTQPPVVAEQPEPAAPAAPPTPTQPTSYDPNEVVALAIAKCKAGGMITTTDNLANLLAAGTITQDEYNEYYPYDGLGYYSVFVETDLNAASDITGAKLPSMEAIADHIAGMMLLETNPLFNISYAGTTSYNGADFYEFRCYR